MCQIILKHTSCMFTREARSGVSRQWMMYAPKSPPFPETSWVNLWNWLKGITIRARTDGYLSRTSFFPSTKERSWSSISILGSYLTMKQVGPQTKRKLVSLNHIIWDQGWRWPTLRSPIRRAHGSHLGSARFKYCDWPTSRTDVVT